MKNKWIRWKLWFILFIFLIDICARNGVAQFWGEEEKPEKERDRETETEKEKEKEKNGWIKKLQCRRRMQIPNETLRWPKGGFRVVVSMSFVIHAFWKCGETSISTCQQGVESICLSCSYFDFWTGAKWTATEPFNRATPNVLAQTFCHAPTYHEINKLTRSLLYRSRIVLLLMGWYSISQPIAWLQFGNGTV